MRSIWRGVESGVQRWKGAPACHEPDCSASAKALGSLHADGQFRSEHAQVGTDLVFQQSSDLMVKQFIQALPK